MRTEFVSNVHWRAQKAAAGHRCVPSKRAVKFPFAPVPALPLPRILAVYGECVCCLVMKILRPYFDFISRLLAVITGHEDNRERVHP